MKKISAVVTVLLLLAGFTACAAPKNDTPNASAAIANPMSEATEAYILEQTNIEPDTLLALEDRQYFSIAGDPEIAELRFTLDGDDYTYRVAPLAEAADISGMYYEWTISELHDVAYCDATIRRSNGGQGVIEWFDVVPGMMYSLSMKKGATSEKLLSTANKLFVPMQGEAEGDAEVAAYHPILDAYAAAIDAKKTHEQFTEAGLNYLVADCESPDEIGFRITDIDGDGTDELMIGAITENPFLDKIIYDLYTISGDGTAVKVFESAERDRYYYAGKDLFAHIGSSGAADSFESTEQYARAEMADLNYVTDEADYVQAELIALSEYGK